MVNFKCADSVLAKKKYTFLMLYKTYTFMYSAKQIALHFMSNSIPLCKTSSNSFQELKDSSDSSNYTLAAVYNVYMLRDTPTFTNDSYINKF